MDGFAPNQPYLWKLDDGQLLEIPVTTMPGFRSPVHATYLHYLASFSSAAATAYWSSAISMYSFNQMSPSFLLHPLDFIGGDDEPELEYFPGMKVDTRTKQRRIKTYLEMYSRKFEVVPMKEYAKLALNGDLQSRSIQFARSGAS